jgi:hypothetical protein
MLYIFSRCKSLQYLAEYFCRTLATVHAQRASARALGKGGAGAGLYRSSYIPLPTYTVLLRVGGRGTIGHHVYCTPIIKNLSCS